MPGRQHRIDAAVLTQTLVMHPAVATRLVETGATGHRTTLGHAALTAPVTGTVTNSITTDFACGLNRTSATACSSPSATEAVVFTAAPTVVANASAGVAPYRPLALKSRSRMS